MHPATKPFSKENQCRMHPAKKLGKLLIIANVSPILGGPNIIELSIVDCMVEAVLLGT